MGLLTNLMGILGFGIGLLSGLFIGFYLFIYAESKDVEDPEIKPLSEFDEATLENLMPEIPLWVKRPDYDRVDWLNEIIFKVWPFLDKAICRIITSKAEPMFAKYIGKFNIESIEFKDLSLGNLPPMVHGLKVCETNEEELVMEPAIRWAGNPNIVVAVSVSPFKVTIQLVDLHVLAAPRITLKPLILTIPFFANIVVSLIENPYIDFGMNVLGGNIMSIPGLYQYIQETIRKKVVRLYLWPKFLQKPVLDASTGATKKPVGILHVKVVRATDLLKMDIHGLSDPYVKLSLSGEKLPSKKTKIKKKTLDPEWNEDFKLLVKDPQMQMLNVNVYDWDKVGSNDRLGTQVFPLKLLKPNEPREETLNLLKDTGVVDAHDMKQQGKIVLVLKYVPLREDHDSFTGLLDSDKRETGPGLLVVNVQGARDLEGSRHNNPRHIIFHGETRKSKMMKKARNPMWNEEFQFLVEEPPLQEKIHIKVMSKRTGISCHPKLLLHYSPTFHLLCLGVFGSNSKLWDICTGCYF